MTAILPPSIPGFVWHKDNGAPATGYTLYFYEPGSSTPKNVYSDLAGATSLGSSLVLDAHGAATFRMSGRYKVNLKDDTGTQVSGFPIDDVNSVSGPFDFFDTLADLKAAGDPGSSVTTHVRGGVSASDGLGFTAYWNTSSTETADDRWIIQATAVSTGRWRVTQRNSSSGRKNKVTNGAFHFSKTTAATALTTAAANPTLDRWWVLQNTTAAGISAQTTSTVTGFSKALKIGRNSGSATTGSIIAIQPLRTRDSTPLAGKKVVLSVYLTAGANFSGTSVNVYLASSTAENQPASTLGSWTGEASVIGSNQVITATDTRYVFTGTVPSTCKQLGLRFYYTPTGTAGADDNLLITGVQIEEGIAPTDFEFLLEREELPLVRQPQIACGRLSNLITNTGPVPGSDPFDSCHFIPYNGNQILINGVAEVIPDGQLAVSGGIIARYTSCYVNRTAGQTLADNTFYWIYVFMNDGVPTLNFSSTVGYYQNGVEWGNAVKQDDSASTLVGICRIHYVGGIPTTYGGARGQTIASYFNQFRASLLTSVSGSITANTATQLPDGSTLSNGEPQNNFLEWVQFYDSAPRVKAHVNASNSIATNGVMVGIGTNTRAAISGMTAKAVSPIASTTADTVNMSVQSAPTDATGYYYAQMLGYEVENAGAGTAYFDGYMFADGVML